MPGKFEKQVQDKMNELQFQPSAPVWGNIEKQIRRKKERRRAILWLPLLVLLLGGGTWWLFHTGTSDHAVTGKSETGNQQAVNTRTLNSPVINSQSANAKNDSSAQHKINPSKEESTNKELADGTIGDDDLKTTKAQQKKVALSKGSPLVAAGHARSIVSAYHQNSGQQATNKKSIESVKKTNAVSPAVSGDRKLDVVAEKMQTANPVMAEETSGNETATDQKQPVGDSVDTIASANDSSKLNNVVVPKKQASSSWKIVVLTSVGTSGLADGLNLFGTKRIAADQFNVQPGAAVPPVSLPNPPSSIQNNLSWTLGVAARRSISRRLDLTIGVQYQYFSNNITVGRLQNRDSVVRQGNVVNQFYANNGTDLTGFTNRYHFVGLPVSIRWQVLKKRPLFLEGGLAVQQLLSTNALLYDDQSNIYYRDNNLLNRTQVAAVLGVQYRFLQTGKIGLLAGPQLQYHFTRTDQSGSNRHLFSGGIGIQMQFEKK